MNTLDLIGRSTPLFERDVAKSEDNLRNIINRSRFLVLGGAGSIGQAVVQEIFKRNPKKLHVIDISENNLAELVRDLRSSIGYIEGDFRTFALDIGSLEYDFYFQSDGQFDFVLNLSALKHVRSEEDPYTLMRMINVNIFNTDKTLAQCIESGVKKYFCVSTDKATNPVNMMGASKSVMEMFLMRRSEDILVSTARFANVAFSDGSLLNSFNQRLKKNQPIVAPNDVKRYFITAQESGQLCLMSCIYGANRDVFFPKLDEKKHLISLSEIAKKFLLQKGYEPHICWSESEARDSVDSLQLNGEWPCFFTKSDTTGEKEFEEFFTSQEKLDLDTFQGLGIIKKQLDFNPNLIKLFEGRIMAMKTNLSWTKEQLIDLFKEILPNFDHQELGKYLDSKM